jgi:hypothetical protein
MSESEHEDLLTEWAARPNHREQAFISDGIIDPHRWEKAPRRVLFLLKEAYGFATSSDLRRALLEEWDDTAGPTIRKASYLAFAAHHANEQGVPEFPESLDDGPREAFLASGLMNVKKSNGQNPSEDDDIAFYMREDARLIERQVELIRPEIVICGYWAEPIWRHYKYVYDMVWRHGNRYFIDFWHPGDRSAPQMAYYALAALLTYSGISAIPPRRSGV